MALINPCDTKIVAGRNTGIECSSALGIPKGLYIVPANDKWTDEDMANTAEFVKSRIHAPGNQRWYPILQGIFSFASTTESDVTEANEITGTTEVIRPGGLTLNYRFKDGGMCLAKALRSFKGGGYRVIIVDNIRQFLLRRNADGTLSGLKSNDLSSAIELTTGTTKFKNLVNISISQDELIEYSELFASDEDISDFNGLIDTEVFKAGAASTTKLKVGVRTECAKTNLIDIYGNVMADLDLYVVTNKATGAIVTPSSAAIVNGIVELTGTYVSGQTYIVKGSTPAIWKTNLVEGYDAALAAPVALSEHMVP